MKTITTNLKYAYVKDIVLLPNISTSGTSEPDENVETEQVTSYKSRLTISYDIKDENGVFVEIAHREHFSDASAQMLSYPDYTAWRIDNEADFIAADKLELVNFTGE
jgi:hypothetical protein